MGTISGNNMAQSPFTLFSDNKLHRIQWIKVSKEFKA